MSGSALSAWKSAGRTLDYRTHEIFFRRQGVGDAVVLIHGFPTASWDWHGVWDGLVARYDVIAPDLIGFGFSSKPLAYDYSLIDQAKLVEALLAAEQITDVHIVAHDYGDTVAQELLARHAERQAGAGGGLHVRSVCLLNGGIFPGVHRPLTIQKLLAGPLGRWIGPLLSVRSLRRSFNRIFGPDTQPTEDEIRDFWTLIETNDGRRMVHVLSRYMHERSAYRGRWVGALETAVMPLRMINGSSDPISGAHVARHYRETIPEPDVIELAGIGHYPQIEAPDAVLRGIVELIDAVCSAP